MSDRGTARGSLLLTPPRSRPPLKLLSITRANAVGARTGIRGGRRRGGAVWCGWCCVVVGITRSASGSTPRAQVFWDRNRTSSLQAVGSRCCCTSSNLSPDLVPRVSQWTGTQPAGYTRSHELGVTMVVHWFGSDPWFMFNQNNI